MRMRMDTGDRSSSGRDGAEARPLLRTVVIARNMAEILVRRGGGLKRLEDMSCQLCWFPLPFGITLPTEATTALVLYAPGYAI